ncbi:uncharacterized protein MYCFIDRAFT_172452 [Pseudocercospora fijiensis CIRAD86]|uniref:Uncharacterized protein n=1 Tax=Pseudocercospora fijiensis (strain CIRAD86) TaxID=383855 RepID=M3A6P7_PSEFD|nr:uncharacterized protein MYCFIDRAFT_172452 [Pseudocercospora fijiensis CIRAD86]EME86754.1 hypothetical protein MYCFIDRAFT_172452 [Pseudocercospora fijiensis CIRAD86]
MELILQTAVTFLSRTCSIDGRQLANMSRRFGQAAMHGQHTITRHCTYQGTSTYKATCPGSDLEMLAFTFQISSGICISQPDIQSSYSTLLISILRCFKEEVNALEEHDIRRMLNGSLLLSFEKETLLPSPSHTAPFTICYNPFRYSSNNRIFFTGDVERPSTLILGRVVTEVSTAFITLLDISRRRRRTKLQMQRGLQHQPVCMSQIRRILLTVVRLYGFLGLSPFKSLVQIFGGIDTKELAQMTRGGIQGGVGFLLHHSRLEKITTKPANACFTKFLNRRHAFIDVENLKIQLNGDSEAFECDAILASWRAMLKSMQKKGSSAADVDEHFQLLFQYGLGEISDKDPTTARNEKESLHFWSFCRGGWVDRDLVMHCWKCNSCYDDAWHCDTCGVCKIGRKFKCDGCGGWSEIGAVEGIEDGRAVTAGQKRGRRAEKRKRESMQDGSHAAARATHG